jgi:hypothetical protein
LINLKTQLLLCLVVLGILPGLKKTGTNKTSHLYHTAVYPMSNRVILHKSKKTVSANRIMAGHAVTLSAKPPKPAIGVVRPVYAVKRLGRAALLDSVSQLLRLKMYLDPYDYDDIVIGFNAGATFTYNYNNDSEYLAGIGAAEGLASFSSDGIALSVNFLPLPKLSPDVIRLKVEAQNSGTFTMMRTELDALPKIYQLWLMDSFQKDSLDLRADSNYVFTVNKNDTSSFGNNRFKVVVREDPSLMVHLLSFNAAKANSGAQISWTTENEENYTGFALERSSDGGTTFTNLESIASTGAGNYSYTDATPPQASDVYRLQITDLNGAISYSNPITLIYGNTVTTTTAGNVNIYPNPTTGVLNLQINGGGASASGTLTTESLAPVSGTPATVYNIKIVNVAGMVMKTATSSTSTWQDNVASLSPGTYVITVVNNENNALVGHSTFVKL